jgi:hypothetical protein
MRRAGVEADLHVYEAQSHGDYAVAINTPESFEHFAELKAFVLAHLSRTLATVQDTQVETLVDIKIPSSVAH